MNKEDYSVKEHWQEFYISNGKSNYLWRDGKIHHKVFEGNYKDRFNRGYWKTREEAQTFLDNWRKKMNWLTKEYIAEQAEKSEEAALECSIEHWEQIKEAGYDKYKYGEEEDKVGMDADYCALCQRYSVGEGSCDNCPLYKTFGKCTCDDEHPWALAIGSLEEDFDENVNNMVEALKSLRKTVLHIEGKDIPISQETADNIIKQLETTHKIGDLYRVKHERYAVLAQVDYSKVCMIGLDGNRWNDPVEVKDVYKITDEEFKKIYSREYELLGKAKDVVEVKDESN